MAGNKDEASASTSTFLWAVAWCFVDIHLRRLKHGVVQIGQPHGRPKYVFVHVRSKWNSYSSGSGEFSGGRCSSSLFRFENWKADVSLL
jgi:hypothetical protein